MFIRRTNTRDS
jgi:hypothetical protein